NQVLQSPTGYSTKASVTSAAITSNGVAATASNLLGTGTVAAGSVSGTAENVTVPGTPITTSTKLTALGINNTEKINFNGGAGQIDFLGSGGVNFNNGAGGWHLDLNIATVGDLLTALNSFDS